MDCIIFYFIPKGIGGIDFSTQICLKFLQKQKVLKELLTLNFKTNEKIRNFANGKFARGCG